MSRYVVTQCSFYTDPDLRKWSIHARWLYRYLYENDHVHGITGIGRVAVDVICLESGLSEPELEAAKTQIGDRVRWYSDGSYWVVARAKHAATSPKHVKPVLASVNGCNEQLCNDFWQKYSVVDTEKGAKVIHNSHTLSIGYTVLPSKAKAKAKNVNDSPSPTPSSQTDDGTAETADGEIHREPQSNGNNSQEYNDWGNGMFNQVLSHAPVEWQTALRQRSRTLTGHPPARVLAHILDVQHGTKQPENLGVAMSWILGRLKSKRSPSDQNYDRAKRLLKVRR